LSKDLPVDKGGDLVVELVSFEFSFVHQGLQMGLVFRHSVFEVGKLILQQFCQIESMLALFVLVVKSSMSDLLKVFGSGVTQ